MDSPRPEERLRMVDVKSPSPSMEKPEKKGFLGSFLRGSGLAKRVSKLGSSSGGSSSPARKASAGQYEDLDGPEEDNGVLLVPPAPQHGRRRTVSSEDPRRTRIPGSASTPNTSGGTGISSSGHRRRVSEPLRDAARTTTTDFSSGGTLLPTSSRGSASRKGKSAVGEEGTEISAQGSLSVMSHSNSHSFTMPLTRWPPAGISIREELPHQHALELIARGAPTHKGRKRAVAHASDEFYAIYATTTGNHGGVTDSVNLHDAMVQMMTLRVQAQGHATYPWETLEQPSYCFYYGQRPGTITLNQWATMASVLPPVIALRDSGVEPRPIELYHIFKRLKELQAGLEDDDSLLYKNLYKRLLRDPEKFLSPHKTLDKQITDLIMVLSRPNWIDFTDPRNQVATRFIFNKTEENDEQYHKFFHQLLLSLELELRIHSHQHGDWAKEQLLGQIPPTIKWNLALARRWRENVRVEGYGETSDMTKLRYKLKKRQVKMLRRFAQLMKWPNLKPFVQALRAMDENCSLDAASSDSFAFFSGLVLPGPTFPFLIMNTLLDIDPDKTTDDLALLSHIHPNCGFQYGNSHTYWAASCIVGKVIAPTCRSVAGWVGPGRPTADLGRSQIARIRTRVPKQKMQREDVETMGERSEALGPSAESYPVYDYRLPKLDDGEAGVVDTVRMEMLSFKPVVTPMRTQKEGLGPRLFDAGIQFAIDGVSWPLRLTYDVSFISAWPCSEGPHPLFYDYAYQVIRADEIMTIRNWGGLYGGQEQQQQKGQGQAQSGLNSERSTPKPPAEIRRSIYATVGNPDDESEDEDEDVNQGFAEKKEDDEKVLVIDAAGVRDNEVLARAWCSHWGLSAVVADLQKSCLACAIREAYAATLTVVIMVDSAHERDD